MKRIIAFTFCIMLIVQSYSAFADKLDYSVLKNNELIDVEINNDGNAFIESFFGKTDVTHENSLEDYPTYPGSSE